MKHLIVIHGRASKPSGSEKERLVRDSIVHGLSRVSPTASARLGHDVKFSFVYYGDINNRELVKARRKAEDELVGVNDGKYAFKPCERARSYDADLELLFRRSNDAFTRADYKAHLAEFRDRRFLDEVASVTSAVTNLFGLNDDIILRATPDMGAYLVSRKVGSEVRERLATVIKPALLRGDDICLVSHSMGCIVSYDVLWKLSQMSEYADVQRTGHRVNLWLTLGCPLGEPGVRKNLYDAKERNDGQFPKHIIKRWNNVAAMDDFVAHDRTVKDDFKEMEHVYRYVESIEDSKSIYNFWVGYEGTNPHKFYGYLDHPVVAKSIADWMNTP